MRLAKQAVRLTSWLGVLVMLWLAGLPLVAIALEFRPPRRGIPGRREGGGTRDPLACVQGNPARLTAILPQTNLGLTTAEYPRFFWYLPQTRAKTAEFSLYQVNDRVDNLTPRQIDEKLKDQIPVYRSQFDLTGTAGVASLSLPKNATLPPLVAGRDYRWSVAIICDPNNRQRDIKVDGWVQRVAPAAALSEQLVRATPSDRLRLYASNGYWFDTLSTLAELRCSNPTDTRLTASWTQLMRLEGVRLDEIAGQPLIQQCKK
jgi:hypothetical protein